MPGLLMMNNSGADNATGPRDGESKKRSHDGKLVNGERTPRKDTPAGSTAPNGSSDGPGVNGASAPVSSLSMPSSSLLAELPPEIVHVASEFYHPLSKLLQRIAQDCSNDLSEVLQTMAEMPISQQRNGAMSNGVGSYGVTNGADNELSKTKKLLLMKFAQDNRSKFIKLLVLTEWGKKSSIDVAKLIDLFTWAREQSSYMDFVDTQIESIKWLSNHARQYNPDIRTALEVLSTGKAGWIPDMGYAPPEPISSDKALKLLRYANTSLSIRLNVHENLPRHLRNWRIEDGRATFVIDNEFEFDVMSFVEDASDQWFFIDLRLLFSPAPSITIGSRFMMSLKTQVDYILNQQGLTGCFEFLHNFALTHKISVLRSQAHELWRSTWAGSLKVEPVHRALVIQYWIDRPGKKNWIEIGLSSNRPKSGKVSWRGPPLSSLTIRWFRHGVEVKDANLKPDWKNLSVERILKQVIALHIGHILQTTQSHLNPGITIKAGLSESEPTDCTLEASLGTSTNKMILSLEPVTGAYILQPATMLSARAEHAINQGREPTQIGLIITQLLAQTLQDLVLKNAQQVGWQPISRQSLRSDVVKKALNLDVLQYALFWSRGWSPNWALAAITDSSGESWWICEIGSKGNTIEYAEKLNMERPDGKSLPINRSTLASIERVAVQHVSFRVTARQLAKEKKQYTLRYEFGQYKHAATSKRIIRGWVMCLRTADLLTPTPGEEPWLESTIAVTCEGFRQDNRNIWHIASGRMVKDVAADMQKLMAASPQNNFSFSEDGAFNILLSTPFGQDILGELKARLRDVNRLRSFAMTLQKRKMLIKSSSLQKVQFQYGKSHVVAVNFGADDGITIELATNNPHYRVRKLLTEIINDRSPTLSNTHLIGGSGLDRFCSALVLTRPLQTVLQEIENSKPDNVRNPAIHTHAIGKYRITYENPLCSFDIRLQLKEDRNFWVIEDNNRKNNESRPSPERGTNHRRLESLQTALKNLFKEKGDHWFGTRSGIVAQIDGVADAVRKLHKAVQSCEMEGGYKPPPVPPNAGGQGPPNASGPTQQQGPGKPGAPGRQQPPQGPGGPGRQQPPQQGSRGGSLSNSRQQGKVGNMTGKASMASRDIIEID